MDIYFKSDILNLITIGGGKVNLKQFADLTGYSVSTISKVFSDNSEISIETKSRIIEKAKELGIFEKYNKNKYDKKVIALIIPEFQSDYYTQYVVSLNKILTAKNYTMTVSSTNFSMQTESDLISFYSSNGRADGIIVVGAKTKSKKYSNTPIVYINGENNNQEYADCIQVDFYPGIFQAITTLKENGHTKIGYIGENLTKGKYMHFVKAMKQCKLTVDESLVFMDKSRFEEAGYLGMKKLFNNKNLPTAILSGYDYIALGIIHFLEEHSLSVPNDVSLVGIDDIQFASYHKISLSTIKVNIEQICEICVAILSKKINNPSYKIIQSVNVKSEFVNRSSIKKL